VRQTLRKIDQAKFELKYRKALADLRQNLIDIRIYVDAYELSEERGEQLQNAAAAKKWLAAARDNILTASEDNIFGAVDVAHLTAQIEQIIGDLK